MIGVAPELSAGGAGVPADMIANRALILSWVVGAVAVSITYVLHVRNPGKGRVCRLVRREPATVAAEGGDAGVPAAVGEALLAKRAPTRPGRVTVDWDTVRTTSSKALARSARRGPDCSPFWCRRPSAFWWWS